LLNAARQAGRASRWRKGAPGKSGAGGGPGRIDEFSDPKSERGGPKGAVWRTRLNEIN